MANPCVCNGATLLCDGGTGPSTLQVKGTVTVAGKPVATIKDKEVGANIPPFPMCKSLKNPQVQQNKNQPVSCQPVITGNWVPPGNPTVKVGDNPILTSQSKCNCAYGVITVLAPGQEKVQA